MVYVADTMALVWHLEKHRRLGAQARSVLQEADQGYHTIVISGATLMEILYLSERQRISVDLTTLRSLLARSLSPHGRRVHYPTAASLRAKERYAVPTV